MGNVIIRPIIAGGKIITNQPKNEKYWEVAGYKKQQQFFTKNSAKITSGNKRIPFF